MSNRLANTHRRPMRPVTPVSKAVRGGAGMAVAASFVMAGTGAAMADTTAPSDVNADAQNSTVVAPEAAPTVTIPVADADVEAEAPTEIFGAVALADSEFKPARPDTTPAPTANDEDETSSLSASSSPSRESSSSSRESSSSSDSRSTDSSSTERRSSGSSSSSDDDSDSSKKEKKKSKKSSEKSSDSEDSSGSSSAAAPSGSVLSTARSGIGVSYVSGGTTRSGWDCSGFVNWVYAKHGVNLPRTSGAIAGSSKTKRISASEARPGDLIYKPGHIGIYAGNGKMVDAGNSRVDTSERKIYSGSWTYYRVVG